MDKYIVEAEKWEGLLLESGVPLDSKVVRFCIV